MPWHTARAPVTRIGDAAVGCTDAWGRIANDVLGLSRPEIGELAEGEAGGSSTMPHKRNPVLSALIRRAALAAPQLAATLHLAAAELGRRAGRRRLARRVGNASRRWCGVPSSPARRRPTSWPGSGCTPTGWRPPWSAADVGSEQQSMAELAGHEPSTDYRGATDEIIDAALDRARRSLKSEEPT